MSHLARIKTPKRVAASRRNAVKARSVNGFKYRKLTKENVVDILKNCDETWACAKRYATKYSVHVKTIWDIVQGYSHKEL